MAIQTRRGAYTDFDPSKMLPAEIGTVLTGDPNNDNGYAIYWCFALNTVKRILLDDDLIELLSNFASEYSSSSAYSVGDYCFYNKQLYKCSTAIGSVGEAWNSNHWSSTTIAAELAIAMTSGWTATDPNNDGNIVLT